MFRTIRSAAAVLLLLSALAACSASAAAPDGVASLASDAPGANASAAPSASLDPEAAQLAFAECMRDQGIDMPDPETNGGGGGAVRIGGSGEDRDKFQAAMQECEHFLEQAGGFRSEMDPEMLDRMVEFAQCMREHGIDMPDPQADGGIMIQRNDDGSATSGNGATIDPESEEFQAAQEACQPILGDDIGPRTDSSGPGGGDGPSVQTAPDGARP
jgi:hypothetical protein